MEEIDYSLPSGTQIAEFRIIEILGVGGFGITYKAQDTRLGRLVAIKEFLPQELAGRSNDASSVIPKTNCSEDYQYGLTKFLEEAKTLAKFNHPNIVKVLTFVEANGTAYLVMEYVEGEALDEHLKKIHFNGNMAESRIREIIEPILNGLSEVHKAGLLHRDIKPGNIYLKNTAIDKCEPMLIDFGAARQSVGEKSKSISAIISQGYAPPEQYTTRGKQGPYTDIYAIGAVMYYLVTGNKPVESTDRQHEIMDEQPDPLIPIEQGCGYSETLVNAITKTMMLRASSRPQHVVELQKILSENFLVQSLEKQESLNADSDATRKIAKDVVSKERQSSKNPVQGEKLTKDVKPDKKRGGGKLIGVIATVVIAVGGYYGFTQYQVFQQAELEKQQQRDIQQASAKKMKQDEAAWKQSQNKNNIDSYREYLSAWSQGRYAAEAQESIVKLNQQAKVLNEQQLRVQQIKQAQKDLSTLGYQTRVHGTLGKRTEKAIEAFEKQQGMMVTGAVDDIVLNALRKSVDAKLLKEKLAQEKLAADKVAAEKAAKEKALAEKRAADKLAADIALKKKQEQDRLAAIEASKVDINVTVSPSDADITIKKNGIIYSNNSRILPESYEITVKKEGYQSQRQLVEVAKGNSKFNYQLKKHSKLAMELPIFTLGDYWKYTMNGDTKNSSKVIGEDVYKGKPAVVFESVVVMPLPESLRNAAGIEAMSKSSIVDSVNNTFTSHSKLLLDKHSLEHFKMIRGSNFDNPTEMDMDGRIVKGKKWPMKIGNKWETFSSNMTTYNEVAATEMVKVPAGEFYCFKVVSRTEGKGFTMLLTTWYSSEVKYMVKSEIKTHWTNTGLNLEDSVNTTELIEFNVSN